MTTRTLGFVLLLVAVPGVVSANDTVRITANTLRVRTGVWGTIVGHVHNGYIIDNGEVLRLKEGQGRYTYGDTWYTKSLVYELVDEREEVYDTLRAIAGAEVPATPEAREESNKLFEKTAGKRICIRIRPDRVVSWDHSKLGGGY